MNNSKLIKLLGTFNLREIQQFHLFVQSDFNTSNLRLKQLATILLDLAPDFPISSLNKRTIYSKLFDSDYQEKRMNNLISDLFQLLEMYLVWNGLNQRKVLQKEILAEVYMERELPQFAVNNLRKLHKKLEETHERSYSYYQSYYEWSELEDRFVIAKGLRSYDKHLQLKNDHLDLYYWINKFRIACDMESRNKVSQAGYTCHHWEVLEKQFLDTTEALHRHPVLQIYYLTFQMLNELNQSQHYFNLKPLLEDAHELFPAQELNNIYKYLLNYCVRKINTGDERYYKEVLDLYKTLLDQGILLHNGSLSQWTYVNIVTAGIRLEEYEWTESFIYEYRSYLLPEERENVFKYSLSTLFFEKDEYLKALEYLNNVVFTNPTYHLRTKIIQLKSYYELKEEEAMLSLIEAFQKYISRSKTIPDYQKKANHNFLKLTKSLHRLRVQADLLPKAAFKKKYQQFEGNLIRKDPLANKMWLKEQLWRLAP